MSVTIGAIARKVLGSSAAYWTARRRYYAIRSRLAFHDLARLATIHGCDKHEVHSYTPHYETHFGPRRRRPLKILEIGVGGYDDPRAGGASLRMWKYYFPKSEIFSIDIFDKSAHEENRIRIFRGSQDDSDFLRSVVERMGRPDIVIDDGSHRNAHVIASFETLFPLLADGGIYVVEDTQTSYWPAFGGDSYDLDHAKTTMNLLKARIDGLNHQEIARKDHQASYLDLNVASVHFYHNLVFVYKGANDEPSNFMHEHRY